MKLRLVFSLFVGCLIADAEPQFLGLFSSVSSGTRFIVGFESGAPPQWVKLGETVSGYAIVEYLDKDETLLLRKDGRTFSLKLKTPKVQQTDLRHQPIPLAAAKQLIGNAEGWDSEVTYRIVRDKDGRWFLFASRSFGEDVRIKIQLLTAESVPLDSPEIAENDRPNKAPEPTTTAVTPRAP